MDDELRKARNSAFQFLKTRNRSEKETRLRLLKKKFTGDVVEQTIQYLKSVQLLDDRQFARDWIQMRRRKPFGARRILFELREKGIASEIIKEEIEQSTTDYSEVDAVISLAQKCLQKYQQLDQPTALRRLAGYLSRRGFNNETIEKVINHL